MTPRPEEVERLARRLYRAYLSGRFGRFFEPQSYAFLDLDRFEQEGLRAAARLVLRTYRPAPKGPKAAKRGKARRL